MDFNPETLVGKTITNAIRIANLKGYKIKIEGNDQILGYNWLTDNWPKKTIVVSANTDYIISIKQIYCAGSPV
jgi:hypothetical protein